MFEDFRYWYSPKKSKSKFRRKMSKSWNKIYFYV